MKDGDEVKATKPSLDARPTPLIEEGEFVFLKIRRADIRFMGAFAVAFIGSVLWSGWVISERLAEIVQLLRVR